jgi:hypothetical protein
MGLFITVKSEPLIDNLTAQIKRTAPPTGDVSSSRFRHVRCPALTLKKYIASLCIGLKLVPYFIEYFLGLPHILGFAEGTKKAIEGRKVGVYSKLIHDIRARSFVVRTKELYQFGK